MLRASRFVMAMGKLPPAVLFSALADHGVTKYFGVPDSLMKDFCAYVTENTSPEEHVVTANEGNAIAMAAGHHLATRGVAAVYLQNSGLGNCVNPLLSLMHKEVYQVPALLIVGWRGEPGVKDEPQHVAQGRLTEAMLKTCEIPYSVLEPCEDVESHTRAILDDAFAHIRNNGTPYALLVRKDTFDKYTAKEAANTLNLSLGREAAVEQIIRQLNHDDIVVCTTGMPSREVYEIRERVGMTHSHDFLTVGSMGHGSSTAMGIALAKPGRNVYCLDGDGAALMHMGAFAVCGGISACHQLPDSSSVAAGSSEIPPPPRRLLSNFKHIVLNNGAHDSVGGQATAAFDISLTDTAKACGYNIIRDVAVMEGGDLLEALKDLQNADGPAFLEILVKKGNRPDIGRPKTTPVQNKSAFMDSLATTP